MELVKDKEGVEGYKYIADDKIAKREKASQEAKKSPIHNNLETKEFTIDLYKGLPTFYTDRIKKIRRLKKIAKGAKNLFGGGAGGGEEGGSKELLEGTGKTVEEVI